MTVNEIITEEIALHILRNEKIKPIKYFSAADNTTPPPVSQGLYGGMYVIIYTIHNQATKYRITISCDKEGLFCMWKTNTDVVYTDDAVAKFECNINDVSKKEVMKWVLE